jgi:hypothetical protein
MIVIAYDRFAAHPTMYRGRLYRSCLAARRRGKEPAA